MRSADYPFKKAIQNDDLYYLIAQKENKKFWKHHENGKPADFYSDEFMDLVTNMI
jgi:hypothetical protein